MQHTLKSPVTFTGYGLHGGKPAKMILKPAAVGHGIWFKRTDIEVGDTMVPAAYDMTEHVPLCTRLVNASGVSVSTVEHIMAALAGCGLHNVLIEIDGPEVPVMDGSSVAFVRTIMAAGLRRQAAPVLAYEILKPVSVEHNGGTASLVPSENFEIEFTIDFEDKIIGRQSAFLNMSNGAFARELSDSRTFCRKSDVDMMRENGLAQGGTLDNAVVVDGETVLTPGGLRHEDEAVRHKMLDAFGDLYLAGGPILGRYIGERSGHTATNKLLRKLFETPGAVRPVLCTPEQAARLPGQGLVASEIPQVA
ncbi:MULTISPECIES: UDP-3-O-acyl-N-acetylglucosamine deacetylase [unclassified Ruegeria]|uniref:UDP-3-O-acyl-N-acetylglucosamine deacetylase n=1 Tax=unclassified Ruegeria TaxID=2625375 RepID=UPI0014896304|nr:MULTISPECIES: UDP-3-O-acyl-N-acetylglucosamine deacetylase [unclassified Ruegeria]